MEVDHGEKAVVHAKAEKELHAGMSPGDPESQERDGKERAIVAQCSEPLQNYFWGGNLCSWPATEDKSFRDLDKILHDYVLLLSKEVV